jgi:hypothetical protein
MKMNPWIVVLLVAATSAGAINLNTIAQMTWVTGAGAAEALIDFVDQENPQNVPALPVGE